MICKLGWMFNYNIFIGPHRPQTTYKNSSLVDLITYKASHYLDFIETNTNDALMIISDRYEEDCQVRNGPACELALEGSRCLTGNAGGGGSTHNAQLTVDTSELAEARPIGCK